MSEDPNQVEEILDIGEGEESEDPIPRTAFFSPDGPIARSEGEIPEDAFYSPDDPVKQDDLAEGVVTNLGGWEVRSPEQARSLLWEIRRTADLLESLARDLRESGVGALKVKPGAEPMDLMIRSLVGGYLVGRHEEEG